ncbi:N-acetylated-alpha-linked acidic dipeptidase 2-like [Saccostrea cucullata]|uniref:N-acetylated-alpha-linked acidic dipeptidase 2-like n=1 Tax=Saccostrea cuccullata TaxID=36930 RepID=UPI002ED61CCD
MTVIKHKSYFLFSKDLYPTSEAKPLSEWCPEMTSEILQEKIDAIQTNLTIDRKNTTKHKRTLISAPDDRISARNGDLVYANYGRIKDFLYLINNKSMDLKGKTIIARYGKIYRGDKVKNAQRFNASGIIMYTDPSDFNSTYPDSWWIPPSGLQRGPVGPDGDQLTPLYPATDYAYRVEQSDIENFRIPAQPISYGDALPILRYVPLNFYSYSQNRIWQCTRPDRTIVFCAWGAEEHGLIGSNEWVEEYMKVLYERAVAYLNVDYAVDYNYVLTAGTSPLLQDSLYEATKMVPNPDTSSRDKTVYDAWKTRDGSDDVEPSVYYSLGSGSDMATFYQRAGVPCIDMWFTYDSKKWDILSYPVYHSAYETVYLYEKFVDPNYAYTKSMAELWGILAWNIANEKVLKFDVRRYASAISTFITSLKKDFGVKWSKENVNIAALESAAQNLTSEANRFHQKLQQKLQHPHKISVLESRQINDKLIQFERAFIDCEGLPGRPMYKHVMFAPSMYDSYSDNSFPGIVDTMNEIENRNATEKWGILKQQVSVATFTIQSAANTLTEVGL